METSASRRAFLRGRSRSAIQDIRPPWAAAPEAFEERCHRCGDCIQACPRQILTIGDGGFPRVDFGAGECTFCGECVTACDSGALHREPNRQPWQLKVTIGANCLAKQGVECRICGECCERSAIRFRPRPGGVAEPELQPEHCTGCGACFAPCPVGAITLEEYS